MKGGCDVIRVLNTQFERYCHFNHILFKLRLKGARVYFGTEVDEQFKK